MDSRHEGGPAGEPAPDAPLVVVLAGGLAGAAVAAVDAVRLVGAPGQGLAALGVSLFGLWIGAGLGVAGVGAALGAAARRVVRASGGRFGEALADEARPAGPATQGRARAALVAAARRVARASGGRPGAALAATLAALPPTLALWPAVASVFSGRSISAHWLGTWGPPLALLALLGAFVAGQLLTRHAAGWRSWALAVVLTGLALAALRLDHTWRPTLYPGLHDVAVTVAWAALWGAAVPVGRLLARRSQRPGTAAATSLAGAALLLGTAAVAWSGGDARSVAWTLPLSTERLARNLQAAVDLDGDGSSPLLGGGDCDDLDPGTTPFVRDLPGDGVDQDCDGADPTPAEVAAAVAAWVPAPPGEPARGPNAAAAARILREGNVLLITVDALRYDRAYDPDGRPRLRSLALLADRAVHFRRAYSPATTTQLSLPAMMTSRLRYWESPGDLAADLASLGMLRALYAHRALVATLGADLGERLRYPAWPVKGRFDGGALVGEELQAGAWGLGVDELRVKELTDLAGAFLGDPSHGRRFTWVHSFELHQWEHLREVPPLDDAAAYDWVLERVDAELLRLLEGLRASGALDRTLVIVTADHGEGLGDRNLATHTRLLYGALTHVPLLVAIPGGTRVDVQAPVTLLDLRPTLRELGGLPWDPAAQGVSLAGWLDAPPATREPPIFQSERSQQAVIAEGLKLIVDRRHQTRELFDVAGDPLDARNLADERPDDVRRLLLLLKASPDYLLPDEAPVR